MQSVCITSPMDTQAIQCITYQTLLNNDMTSMVTKDTDSGDQTNYDINCMEAAIIANTSIPTNVWSQPFFSKLCLTRIFSSTKDITYSLKAFLSPTGMLCVNHSIDWLPFVRIAKNCFEQNLTAILTQNKSSVVLKTIRNIEKGEELKVWLSDDLIIALNIPFLNPINIINENCYQCHRCGQSYCQPNPLKIHLTMECKNEEKTNIITISQTNNSFNANPMITNGQQIRTIREQKAHTCLYCGKVYTRKYGLKIHVRTHTGQKPLRCRYCGRPFSDPSNLNKHIRLHNTHLHSAHPSQHTYQCKLCAKVLVRRRDLERHIRSRHQCN